VSTAQNAWMLTAEHVGAVGLHLIIESLFALLAVTVVRQHRPRGGLVLFGVIAVGMVVTTAWMIAWPVLFALVADQVPMDQILVFQAAMGGVSTLISAVIRVAEIVAVVVVAVDPDRANAPDDAPPPF
jgi:uncharacterized membrane protein